MPLKSEISNLQSNVPETPSQIARNVRIREKKGLATQKHMETPPVLKKNRKRSGKMACK
jgi:hypothetical protein